MKQTRIVAKTLLRRADGRLLLLKRSETDTRRPMQWDLPGGAVDDDEDYIAAAVRETKEEAGILITSEDLTLVYTMSAMTEKGNVCWLIFIGQTDVEKVQLSNEHCEFYWATEQEALEMVTYDRQQIALEYIFENALFN